MVVELLMIGLSFPPLSDVGAVVVLLGAAVVLLYFVVWPLLQAVIDRAPWLRFPSNSLRVKTLLRRQQQEGWRWLLKEILPERKSWLTHWSFLWVIPAGFLIAVSLAHILAPLTAGSFEKLQTTWQAQLTITSLSFIVLIFLLDQIYRSQYQEGVMQDFLAAARAMPVIYFSLFTGGIMAYAYFQLSQETTTAFATDVIFLLFVGTITSIGYVYYRVARLIFHDPKDEFMQQEIERGIDRKVDADTRQRIANNILRETLPDYAQLQNDSRSVSQRTDLYTADEIDTVGHVADVDLSTLAQAFNEVESSLDEGTDPEDIQLLLNVELGQKLVAGAPVLSVNTRNGATIDVPRRIGEVLGQAITCSDSHPFDTGEDQIDRNLDYINDSCKQAIDNLNSSGLRRHMEFYTDILQYVTRSPIASSNTSTDLIDRIHREFYHIFDAAADTGNAELINTIRAQTFHICLRYHLQGDKALFDKFLRLYANYYKILASQSGSNTDNLVHGFLVSIENLQTRLTAELGRAETEDEVSEVAANIQSWYQVLEDVFRHSIDLGDAKTFNNVWSLGEDEFILADPRRNSPTTYELQYQVENAEDDEERDRLQTRLDAAKEKERVIDLFQEEFEHMQFIAAARAFLAFKQGELPEEAFTDMFDESISDGLASITKLSEIYFRLRQNPQIVSLLKWESEDSDVFEGVQTSLPATHTWLKEFYCVLCLLLLDPDDYPDDDINPDDNPLTEIDVTKQAYPGFQETLDELDEDVFKRLPVADEQLDQFKQRKELLRSLDTQMQEVLERREEDRIIEADLDPEKVENYKDSYVSQFVESFALRQALIDLDWWTQDELDDPDAIPPSGYRRWYPKHPFIEDQREDYVQHLDADIASHVTAIIERILDECDPYLAAETVSSHDAVPDQVAELCPARDPVALIVGRYRPRRAIRDSDAFDPDYTEFDHCIGGFQYAGNQPTVPVYSEPEMEPDVLLLTEPTTQPEFTERSESDAPVDIEITAADRDLIREVTGDEEYEKLSDGEIRDLLQCVRMQIEHRLTVDVADDIGVSITVEES
ncbi:hypothetical protein LPA44_17370 [Halobacterium sp. KA-4]|uniref:hypothetical protein n=1 Tax=Halobacterium sp. KA-4 TaxID=2896367 RepID=UPI001E5FFF41|nr:hypothetical protein [Halobacterium sp. KA-4]MCD2201634.1 hypothetical protein [Halobacterium sp. KA-4]